jgi:transposase
LWDEYIERYPDGYRYSRFCELYGGWASRVSVTMRQAHAGGDKLFVDYAGDTVPVIIDRLRGKTRRAQIFVAVMGASNFTYAEASWTQALGDWIGAHTRAFEAIGGVPNLLVPDNTKSLPRRRPGSRSSRPASTSRRSIAPTPRWRRITTPRSYRHGRAAPATRPRSRRRC